MYNPNIKTEIINNIIFTMAEYVDDNTLRILQKVIEEQLVAVNVEEITTLPAEIQTSTEEQNKYYISLMLIKKKKPSQGDQETVPRCYRAAGERNRETIKQDRRDRY